MKDRTRREQLVYDGVILVAHVVAEKHASLCDDPAAAIKFVFYRDRNAFERTGITTNVPTFRLLGGLQAFFKVPVGKGIDPIARSFSPSNLRLEDITRGELLRPKQLQLPMRRHIGKRAGGMAHSAAARCLPLVFGGATSASGEMAGPFRAVPSTAKCDPWHGQSQQRSSEFQ